MINRPLAIKILCFHFILICLLPFVKIISQEKPLIKHPEWSKNSVIYEVNIRQYTPSGSFKEFEKYLPQLQKLGVGILWLMPINPIGELNRKGSLGSYYSVKDYKAVNPEFGSVKDFRHLVRQIHKMKMHVIVDWVANHTSWDNVWIKSHPDFFSRDSLGNFYPPVKDWTDVIDLNYDNKELWDYMIDAMELWIKEYDIDGFRCDVAAKVPTEFWIKAYNRLSKIKKIFMLAEASENYLHQAFDMTYDWKLKDIMNDIAKKKKKASDVIKHFEFEKNEYKPDDYLMVFTSNHDENTWQGTEFERLGKGAETFAVLCGTVSGMPLIYSGQEAGSKKRLRFFEKDTIEWKSDYSREIYTRLDWLKIKNEALWNGTAGAEMKFIRTNNDDVLVFVREKRNSKVLAVFNLSDKNISVNLSDKLIAGRYLNLFERNKKMKLSNEINLNLAPWQYIIYFK
jgi:cyclomaltodextrinase / maltogenic alpha-amylase / neopullulanase